MANTITVRNIEELKKATANKLVGNQKIVIKEFSPNQTSFNCNILYISDDESSSLKKIIIVTQNLPILIQ